MASLSRSGVVAATAEETWAILADFGAIAQWVPLIAHSCPLSDQTSGPGTVRRVQLDRQVMVERVQTWEAPTTLRYSIEGLPPIVGATTNTWNLRPAGKVTEVTLTTEIETGSNPAKRLVAAKVLEQMALASDAMLAGLAKAASEVNEPPSSEENP